VDPAPYLRAGGAWESFRASVRRRGFRTVGTEAPDRATLAVKLKGKLKLEADGIRALFRAMEAEPGRKAKEANDDARQLARALARLIDPAENEAVLSSAVSRRLESLMLEESRDAGRARVGFSLGPGGLAAVLAADDGTPLPELEGATLEIRFANGPTLRQPIRGSRVLFRAGAALLELSAIVGLAFEFDGFGRVELTPD